jgi:hypothetical protein
MTLPPGVRYSILRNKVEVPLIPIDQLPFYIQGLPRELTPFRKHQEGWTSIGETHESAVPLSIRAPPDMHSGSPSPSPDTNRQFLPPDHDVRRGPVVVSQDLKPLTELHPSSSVPAGGLVSRLISTPPGRRPVSTTVEGFATARSEGALYSPYRLPNPSGIDPDPSKKEYCTHWIRTNSCDFMQQGCKYKHEMPDLARLKNLGFAETPKWYRQEMAISAGASSWLRPRATTDNNERQLSVEPAASRAFRPSILGLRRDQSRPAELPGSPPPRADHPSVEPPNLIDLDDYSMKTVSLPPPLSISSPPDTPPRIVEKVIEQPSEQVTTTLASSLRQERSDVEKLTKALNGVDTTASNQALVRQKSSDTASSADALLTKNIVNSSATTPSQSVNSGPSNGQEASRINDSSFEATSQEPSIAKSSTTMGLRAKRNSKSSNPQQRRNPRPRKLFECPATSPAGRLASSLHATGRRPREGLSPSKGPKRGGTQGKGRGKDLQLEIMQQQRAAHMQERFSKGPASNDV